jgi:predicted DNA-binding transcriptional regulator YafY
MYPISVYHQPQHRRGLAVAFRFALVAVFFSTERLHFSVRKGTTEKTDRQVRPQGMFLIEPVR